MRNGLVFAACGLCAALAVASCKATESESTTAEPDEAPASSSKKKKKNKKTKTKASASTSVAAPQPTTPPSTPRAPPTVATTPPSTPPSTPPNVDPPPTTSAGSGSPAPAVLNALILGQCIRECFASKDDWKVPGNPPPACEKRCTDPERLKRAATAKVPASWGATRADAIEVCMPSGERAFLASLRCSGGDTPTFERRGGAGSRNPAPADMKLDKWIDMTYEPAPGEVDLHILDLYDVTCKGAKPVELYLDMYHCGSPKPWLAPAGFTRPIPTEAR